MHSLGRVLSLVTINLFLPPSQLLIHPFCKFYSNSPRSPALHSAIARQLIVYNVLIITTSILLCINTNSVITNDISNLLICANLTAVPAIFLSHLFLFKFYSSSDIWTSHGVHLVYQQDCQTVIIGQAGSEVRAELEDVENNEEEEEMSDIENYNEHYPKQIIEDTSVFNSPEAESTKLENQTDRENIESNEQDESTEVDRMLVMKTKTRKLLKSKRKKISQSMKTDGSIGKVVTKGRWVDVSDLATSA